MRIRLIQGANLNLLGERDPGLYGRMTPERLDRMIVEHAARRASGGEGGAGRSKWTSTTPTMRASAST